MKTKLIAAGAAALRRLLLGEDREYRLEWISAHASSHDNEPERSASNRQGTGNAPEEVRYSGGARTMGGSGKWSMSGSIEPLKPETREERRARIRVMLE